MNSRFAVVVAGVITNIVVWDGKSTYDPGHGATLVADTSSVAQIGGTWDGTNFTPPATPVEPSGQPPAL